MPSGSDWGGSSRGGARERRARYAARLVNQRTGEVRRPNQIGMFKAGSRRRFMQTYSTSKGKYQKYTEAVTFDDNGRQVTMPKAEFNRMADASYGVNAERDAQQRAFYRNRRNAKQARKKKRQA